MGKQRFGLHNMYDLALLFKVALNQFITEEDQGRAKAQAKTLIRFLDDNVLPEEDD